MGWAFLTLQHKTRIGNWCILFGWIAPRSVHRIINPCLQNHTQYCYTSIRNEATPVAPGFFPIGFSSLVSDLNYWIIFWKSHLCSGFSNQLLFPCFHVPNSTPITHDATPISMIMALRMISSRVLPAVRLSQAARNPTVLLPSCLHPLEGGRHKLEQQRHSSTSKGTNRSPHLPLEEKGLLVERLLAAKVGPIEHLSRAFPSTLFLPAYPTLYTIDHPPQRNKLKTSRISK